jgi:hypothetical protein
MRYDALRQENVTGNRTQEGESNMSTDIKEVTDTVQEVAFGAAETAAEIASDPIGTVRKQVKGLERKGTPAARKANRRFNAQLNAATAPAMDAFKSFTKTAEKVAGELLPEKVAIKGLKLVKVQARRPDMVGDVAKRTLRFFNHSFKTVARVANRLETATELTSHAAAKPAAKPATIRRPVRRTRSRRAA